MICSSIKSSLSAPLETLDIIGVVDMYHFSILSWSGISANIDLGRVQILSFRNLSHCRQACVGGQLGG